MLMIFKIYDLRLLLTTTGITVAVFALLYALVYRLTSRAYYGIVGGTAGRQNGK